MLGIQTGIGVGLSHSGNNQLLANSSQLANSTRLITIDGVKKTVKEWYDDINLGFDNVYPPIVSTSGSSDITGITHTSGAIFIINDELVGVGVLKQLEVNLYSISSGTCIAKLVEIQEDGKFNIISEANITLTVGSNTLIAGVDIPAWNVGKFQTIGIYYPSTVGLNYRSSGGKGYWYYVGDPTGTGKTFLRTANGQVLIKITITEDVVHNSDTVITESFDLTAIPTGWLNGASYSADGTKITPISTTGTVPLRSNKIYGADNRQIYWQFKFTDAAAILGFGSNPVEGGIYAGSLIVVTQSLIKIHGVSVNGQYNTTVIKSQELNINLTVGNKYNIYITKSGRTLTASIIGETDSVNTVITNTASPLGYSTYSTSGYDQGALQGSPTVFVKDGSAELYKYSHTMLVNKKLIASIHGDSITEGFTVSDEQKFGGLLKAHFGTHKILNSGIGGAISTGLMKRLRNELTEIYPNYEIIHIGTNGTGDTNYNTNIALICTMIKLCGVKPILCTIPTSAAKTTTIKAIGSDVLVAEIDISLTTSGAGSTVKTVDYQGIDANGGTYNDGIHPYTQGHVDMFNVIILKIT